MSFLGALADIGAFGGGLAKTFDPNALAQRQADEAFGRSLAMIAKLQQGNPSLGGGGQAPQSMGPGQPSQAMTKFSPDVQKAIFHASVDSGVPMPLLAGMAAQESSGNPNAPGGGLMQIRPSTAAQPGFGMQPFKGNINDPYANAAFGANYLKARNPGANWSDPTQTAAALRSYNGGGDPNYAGRVFGRMGMPPSQAGGQGGQGVAPGASGGLNLRSVIQLVQQANPGASPRTLAAAVERWVPMLRTDEQQMWREATLGLRAQTEQGRNSRFEQGMTERGREFDTREGRLDDALALRKQQWAERLQTLKDQLEVQRKRLTLATSREDFMQQQTIYKNLQRQYEDAEKQADQATKNIENAYKQGEPPQELQPVIEDQKQRQGAAAAALPGLKEKAQAAQGKVGAQGGAPPPPKVGEVQQGYRYKGGDPSKPESWEKI